MTCKGRQRQLGTVVHLYTEDHEDSYPYYNLGHWAQLWWWPLALSDPGLHTYELLQCPSQGNFGFFDDYKNPGTYPGDYRGASRIGSPAKGNWPTWMEIGEGYNVGAINRAGQKYRVQDFEMPDSTGLFGISRNFWGEGAQCHLLDSGGQLLRPLERAPRISNSGRLVHAVDHSVRHVEFRRTRLTSPGVPPPSQERQVRLRHPFPMGGARNCVHQQI